MFFPCFDSSVSTVYNCYNDLIFRRPYLFPSLKASRFVGIGKPVLFERKGRTIMKPWAEEFYNSDAWRECRRAFLQSKHYLCERCSTPDNPTPAKIAHHKIYLTEQNIGDPYISLSFSNLEALCQDCHNKEHHREDKRRYSFDENGNVVPR